MKTFKVFAKQSVVYVQDIKANSLEEALQIAEGSSYKKWEEVDYYDWEIMDEWTEVEEV